MAWLNTYYQAMSVCPCERCDSINDVSVWIIEGMTMYGEKFRYYKKLCEFCLHRLYKMTDEDVYRFLKGL